MSKDSNQSIPPVVTGALITKLVDAIIQAVKKIFLKDDPEDKGKGRKKPRKKRKLFKKKED